MVALSHIPLEMGFTLATQRKWNLHTKKEMYMANARNLRLGPNATQPIFRKTFTSPNARDTNLLVFFALGNAKVLSFALGDAKVPNANGFASQWNIGLDFVHCVLSQYLQPFINWFNNRDLQWASFYYSEPVTQECRYYNNISQLKVSWNVMRKIFLRLS